MKFSQNINIGKDVVYLDVHQMKITEAGVEDFFWPVSFEERNQFFLDLKKEYLSLIKKHEDTSEDILYFKLMAKYILADSISIFWGDLLRERFEAAKVEPIVPDHWRVWPNLFNCKTPPPAYFSEKFVKSPNEKKSITKKLSLSRLKRITKILNLGKLGVNLEGIKIKPLTQSVLKNDIIATDRHETIAKHAKNIDQDVVFSRSNKWFSPISENDLNESRKTIDQKFIKEFEDLIKTLYLQNNIEVKDHSKKYYKDLIETGASSLKIHYKRILEKKNKLPRNIWTGSGGNVWDLMLRIAVAENGGEATGHDHGAGLGHVNNPMMGLIECWGAQKFMSFNKNQATELTKNLPFWDRLDNNSFIIDGIDTSNNPRTMAIYPKFKDPTFKVKTVAMMATIYDLDRGRPGPSSPDIIHVDWQARLIPKLREWGYEVIIKLHPESPILPPKSFETEYGAKLVTTRLEDILDDLDMVLFDCLYTTAVRATLSTNVPMTLIDFYKHPWTDKGKELFKKRSNLIEGYFDKDNREQVHWDELKKSIENSHKLCNNHEFFNYYYA